MYAIDVHTQDIAMNDELLLLLLLLLPPPQPLLLLILLLLIQTEFSQCIQYQLHEMFDIFSQSTAVEQRAALTYSGSASSPALHQAG